MEAKTFKSELVKAYAAVVRNLLPSVAVKHYTLKSNANAKLFLPGPEWELAHIIGEAKPTYYGSKLSDRRWSLATRVELMGHGYGHYLINDISTDAELEALLFDKDGKAHGDAMEVVRAFKVRTPGREIVKKFLDAYPAEKATYVAYNVPVAFEGLTVNDILRGSSTNDLNSPYWDVARGLAEFRPGWAIKFLSYMRKNFTVSQIKEDKLKFNFFFNRALSEKSDLSGYMPYFRNNFPEYVEAILDKAYELENFGHYFEVEFKATLCDLEIPSPKEAKAFTQVWGSEAKDLLRIGYNLIDAPFDNSVIHRVFRENLETLKEKFLFGVNSILWEELLDKMLKTAKTLDAFFDVYRVAPQRVQWKGVSYLVHGTLLDSLNVHNVEDVVDNFFPFSDWEEDEAKLMLRKMAENKVMPLAHLKELPLQLKEYALRQVEIQAQKELIDHNANDIWKITLLPEAEIYLIQRIGADFLLNYVSERGLSQKAFTFLVQKFNQYAAEALQKHAERWLITRDQWLMLTQSKYAYLAPLVKIYVK